MLRADLQGLSLLRVREARSLYAASHFDGAYYLGGPGVECALKACIARKTRRFEFPDKPRADRAYNHRLEVLMKEAGLELELARASDAVKENWTTVRDWKVEVRYATGRSRAECQAFLAAVTGRDGALPWLKRFW